MILRILLLVGFLSATTATNAQQLASEQDFLDIDKSISADGRFSVFAENVFSIPGNTDAHNFVEAKLYLVDSFSNTTTLLHTTDEYITGKIKLSADGKFIAFHEAANGLLDLYRYEISTGEKLLASADSSGVLGITNSVMSPDGRYFAYTRKSLSSSLASDARNTTLYLFDAETKTVEVVGPQCSSLTIHRNLTISSEINFFSYGIYCVDTSTSQNPSSSNRIYLYDIANKTNTRIDPDSIARHPRISNNGRYVRYSGRGTTTIYDRLSAEYYTLGVSTECVDSDGDGWGFIEYRNQSCNMAEVSSNTSGTPVNADCDYSNAANFNGWGWNPVTGKSCSAVSTQQPVVEAPVSDCDYSNADSFNGWGWNPVTRESCAPVSEEQPVVEAPVNACDYSNADSFNGWGWNPVTRESCAPANEEPMVVETTANVCDYSNASSFNGWGWNAATRESCAPVSEEQPVVEEEPVAENSSIGCNYSSASSFNGWGWNPITQQTCPPTNVVVSGAEIADGLVITRETINNLDWPESGGGSGADISANGRYIVFASRTLSPSNSNQFELFVRDTVSGVTRQLLTGRSNVDPDGNSRRPVISADGRFVAFTSDATNLTSQEDTNGVDDVFVLDLQTNVITAITHGEKLSYAADISHDGRYVSFQSEAKFTANDLNGRTDIYVHDRLTGNYTLASVTSDGIAGFQSSAEAHISGNGRYVLFESQSSDFALEDRRSNGNSWFRDIFLHDLQTGETRLLSADTNGAAINNACNAIAISGNGAISLFRCDETRLAANTIDDNMYIYDQQTDSVSLLNIPSVVPAGTYPRAVRVTSDSARLSDDGRYVVFASPDRIPSVTPENTASLTSTYQRETHIYRHDRETNTTQWLARNVNLGDISADGRFFAFSSDKNFTANDANRFSDTFLADLDPDNAASLSIDPLCTTTDCFPFGIDWVWDGDISKGVITDTQTLTEAFYEGSECVDQDGDGFGWQQPPGTPGRGCLVP